MRQLTDLRVVLQPCAALPQPGQPEAHVPGREWVVRRSCAVLSGDRLMCRWR
jgi:hypothetical protein